MSVDAKACKTILNNNLGYQVDEVTPIVAGEWSDAFYFNSEDKEYVIKFNKSDDDFEKESFVFELASQKLPLPEIYKSGFVNEYGMYYLIEEKAKGEKYLEEVGFEEIYVFLDSLFEVLNSLKSINIKNSGFGYIDRFGKGQSDSWREFILDVKKDKENSPVHGWYKNLTSQTGRFEKFMEIYKTLESQVEFLTDRSSLIHSDLLHFNVFLQKGEISGIIDWGSAKIGDPFYELAWFETWKHWYPVLETVDFIQEAQKRGYLDGETNVRQRIHAYKYHIILDSLVYNSFKEDWGQFDDTLKMVERRRIVN